MRVAVTGSSGLVGSALLPALREHGHHVVRLVRPPREPGPDDVLWDPPSGALDAARLEGVDAVVHLAGESIGAARWTEAQKRAIHRSRVEGTRLLAKTISSMRAPPHVVLSASANGYYGDRGDEVLTEDAGPGTGFRARVCVEWENAAREAESERTRVVLLRSGIVLARHGGLLPFLMMPFRFFAGGRLGSGMQWVSWISLDDGAAAIVHVLEHTTVRGPVNITAPHPIRNVDLARTIGDVTRRPSIVRVPAWLVRIGAGRERADEVLLSSQRCVPQVLRSTGFRFRDADVATALRHIVGRDEPPGGAHARD